MEKPSDFAVRSWITTVWNRITVSRLTIFYFSFSVLHFVAQIALQSKALMINESALNNLAGLVTNNTQLSHGLPIMEGSTLKVCTWVPINMQTNGCTVIWDATSDSSQLFSNFTSTTRQTSSATQPTTTVSNVTFTTRQTSGVVQPTFTTQQTSGVVQPTTTVSGITFTTQQTSSAVRSTTTLPNAKSTTVPTVSTTRPVSPTATSIKSSAAQSTTTFHAQPTTSSAPLPSSTHFITSSALHGSNATNPTKRAKRTDLPISSRGIATDIMQELRARSNLDSTCQASLVWPISVLRDSQREDIVFIAFQCWVLGVSIVAILNESIPHICASMITHFMATCWAAFRIYDTAIFKSNFNQVIEYGACDGVDILSEYWDTRYHAELAGLIINVVAMLIAGYLTWKMFELFGWQTFKRVGASLVINRIYRLVLVLSTVIQLSFFFMVTTVSLWIDRLVNSPIGDLADFRKLYLATSAITLLLLVPWLATGWLGVRRELRLPMFFFLFLSLLYLGGYGVMFFSTTFLWTFITWSFFAIMACASVFFATSSFILGVICRYNFGKGLHRHLNDSPSESADVSNYDIEKPKLPSDEMFDPTSPSQPRMILSPTQFEGVAPTWPQRSNSSTSSSSDTPSNTEAGVSRWSSLNSTTGGTQAKRWVIE